VNETLRNATCENWAGRGNPFRAFAVFHHQVTEQTRRRSMSRPDLDKLLEQAVAEAIGVSHCIRPTGRPTHAIAGPGGAGRQRVAGDAAQKRQHA